VINFLKKGKGSGGMKKIAVVFESKYGAVKKYAEWIAEDLSCSLFDRKSIKIADLESYDTIIYGGGLYAGGVSGVKILTKNFDKLSHKNLILFTCGLADPIDKANTDHIKQSLNKIFTAPMQKKIKVFHFRGAMDYSKLGFIHKAMMGMMYRMIMKKDVNSLKHEDKEFLASYGKTVDFTDRSMTVPIVNYIRELQG
jgi:menaquinone-dependent protoporphyrinogen IX oxidase